MTADHDDDQEAGDFSGAESCIFCGALHGLSRAPERDDLCGECASPLCPAEKHRFERSGQRLLARIPKQQAVRLYTTWPQAVPLTAEMRDLSLDGMLLTTDVELTSNQIVKLDGVSCAALGRVAHCRPLDDAAERWLVGVEFLTLRFARQTGTFVAERS